MWHSTSAKAAFSDARQNSVEKYHIGGMRLSQMLASVVALAIWRADESCLGEGEKRYGYDNPTPVCAVGVGAGGGCAGGRGGIDGDSVSFRFRTIR
jgi:hypothetical protein